MCNQRERLIGYVYDDCDDVERVAIQDHLETCAECRTEIASLRAVRLDLQAWAVPEHESVWRPFAPAPVVSWWQQVPRWAMAAAAGLVMMAGAAGGAASYAFLRAEPVVSANPSPTATYASEASLRDLEHRIDMRIKAEVAQLSDRVELATSRPVSLPANVEAALHATFDAQLAQLRTISDRQLDAIIEIKNNQVQIQRAFDIRHEALRTRVANIASALDQGQGK